MNHFRRQHDSRHGFTLIEVLVVVGLISFLMVISIVVMANYITVAREKATEATILKIHRLQKERVEAFQRSLKGAQYQQRINRRLELLARLRVFGVDPKVAEAMVRKEEFLVGFPQTWAETTVPRDPVTGAPFTNNPTKADSSEVLYETLTNRTVFGLTPVTSDEFSTREIGDTDNDQLLEFIDAWGEPLRFYRWPTRLIRPFDPAATPIYNAGNQAAEAINRGIADLLIKGLPAAPLAESGERDPLARDSDDPLRMLSRELIRIPGLTGYVHEGFYHTFDTYHALLIVSAGPDRDLGLYEPNTPLAWPAVPALPPINPTPADFGHLAQPLSLANLDPLTDNITNLNRRAGGAN